MNIAIIENNNLYREGLKIALNQILDFKIVFDTDNLSSFFQCIDNYDFQIVLLDFNYYQTENIQKILELSPTIKILILSNYTEKCFFDKQINTQLLDFIPKCSCKNTFEQKIIKLLNINEVLI